MTFNTVKWVLVMIEMILCRVIFIIGHVQSNLMKVLKKSASDKFHVN